MDFRISAAMQAARIAVAAARTARDTARDSERRAVAAYGAGHSAIDAVHAAESVTAVAEARLDEARRKLAEARAAFELRFLDSLAPIARTLQADLIALADRIDDAAKPARAADAFATAHALPSPRLVADSARAAAMADDLRRLANGQ